MTNTQPAKTLPGAVFLGTVPAGTRFAQLFDGRLIAVHPEHPPMVVTAQGLQPFEETHVQLAPDFTMSVKVSPHA